MTVVCDGCRVQCETKDAMLVRDYNHQVRYCTVCTEIYRTFVASCQAHEKVLQHDLDIYIRDLRVALPLKLAPMDLCPAPELEMNSAS
mgnify:CR=1 FL=1